MTVVSLVNCHLVNQCQGKGSDGAGDAPSIEVGKVN